ncbi:DUF5590 domain-containing protein [Brevibacillus ruminantium]|uniref:DUF5590 domain-containing protein n=1 Tax=Brevibacillus ruminantium TaxID=2950604 RepID=A0ABY4W8U1_9BACL|nr:DUF5590 domain-containing protein [Brevibacillus ruminantium]USG63468.1 DUF5590 domain-containing protein [Brevibacillus ruminantium]
MYLRITTIVLAALLLIVLGSAYHLSATVLGKQADFENKVRNWVQERTTITEIDSIDEYRGKQSYAVVIGKNRAGTKVIAWLTEDTIAFDTMERMVTRESVEASVKQGFPTGKILHLVPGMDENSRFWEVTLKNADGRFHYIHYDLYTGAVLTSYLVSP